MSIALTGVTRTQPVAQAPAPSTKQPAKPSAQTASVDSVQLSKTAQASLAVLQEARETAAQTAKEAGSGDTQAQRLLAREAASQPTSK